MRPAEAKLHLGQVSDLQVLGMLDFIDFQRGNGSHPTTLGDGAGFFCCAAAQLQDVRVAHRQ